MPDATLKIENARYLITMDGERRIIREGAVVVDGSRITQVGKTAELADVAADRIVDARGMVGARPRQLPYAHQLRPRHPGHLPRQPG